MRHESGFVLREWGAMEVHKGVEFCWLGRISLVSKWEMNWRNETMEKSGLRIQAGDDGRWTGSELLRTGRKQEKSHGGLNGLTTFLLLHGCSPTDVPPTGVFL